MAPGGKNISFPLLMVPFFSKRLLLIRGGDGPLLVSVRLGRAFPGLARGRGGQTARAVQGVSSVLIGNHSIIFQHFTDFVQKA